MKTKELIEYLQTFDGDLKFGFLILDSKRKVARGCTGIELVKDDDVDFPVIAIELGEAKDLKELERENG